MTKHLSNIDELQTIANKMYSTVQDYYAITNVIAQLKRTEQSTKTNSAKPAAQNNRNGNKNTEGGQNPPTNDQREPNGKRPKGAAAGRTSEAKPSEAEERLSLSLIDKFQTRAAGRAKATETNGVSEV